MPRHKAAQNCEIRPWLSAKDNCKEGRFVQIGNSILLCEAFKKLSPGARIMYVCMSMESGGRIGFQFPRSAIVKYGFNKNYGPKYINELCDAGFIEKVSSGKAFQRPNEYKFTFKWKTDKP